MSLHPPKLGIGKLPRYGGGWMYQFGHVYCLQQELLKAGTGDWFRATELWHTARHEGLALNSAHYGHLLRHHVPAAQWSGALAVLRQMRRDAIRPDVVGVGCAVAACAEAAQWEAALRTVAYFEHRGLLLDSHCYHAATVACNRAGQWDAALAVGARQDAAGVAMLPSNYTALLEACGESDECDMAVVLVRRMAADRLPLPRRAEAPLLELASRHERGGPLKALLADEDEAAPRRLTN
jgi:hypothetical protein